MPVDLEMFLSHTGASLFDYSRFVDNRFSFTSSYGDDDYVRNLSFSKNHLRNTKEPKRVTFLEKKKLFDPDKSEDSKFSCKKPFGKCSDNLQKKKVTFADDKGFSLVEIREIPGLTHLASQPLTPLVGVTNSNPTVDKKWKVAFKQPLCNGNKLDEQLEMNKVALQHVNVKTDDLLEGTVKVKYSDYQADVLEASHVSNKSEDILEGTVKVKNMAYEKNVFVRISFDRWLTSTDIKASYVQPKNSLDKSREFDIFSFNINIPPSSLKYEVVEFCIGFQCNGKDYWDNNNGINYRLVTESVKKPAEKENLMISNKSTNYKITLSLTENIEKFSEIDSWNNFMRNQPYW